MGKVNQISRWKLILSGLIALALAYLLVSRALDTGSWWEYLGTLILLVASIRLFARGIKVKK